MEGGSRARAIACRRTGSANNGARAEAVGTRNAVETGSNSARAARSGAVVRFSRATADSASSTDDVASTVCPHASAAASFQTF